jgi:hypothetical protein
MFNATALTNLNLQNLYVGYKIFNYSKLAILFYLIFKVYAGL